MKVIRATRAEARWRASMTCLNGALAAGLAGLVFVGSPVHAAIAAPQAATSAAANADDGALKSRIAANLKKNVRLAARDLDVDVHEGIMTLKGTVRSATEKARAARLATVKGVT